MSLRELVDADCGRANALMRLGNHFAQDIAHKEDGLSRGFGASSSFFGRDPINGEASAGADQLVNEFLGQAGSMHPPQTFRMDALLQEMRDIDAGKFQPIQMQAPAVIEVVRNEEAWANEFRTQEANQFSQLPIPPSAHNIPHVQHEQSLLPKANAESMVASDFFSSISPVNDNNSNCIEISP